MDLKTLLDTPPWDWPRNAPKMFRKILADPRAPESERLLAAELAGDSTAINDDLAEALLSVVRNSAEPEQLRARSAISLGPVLETADTMEFDDPGDVPITEAKFHQIRVSLRKLYQDAATPKQVRRRILEASVRAPTDWHKEAIAEAYSSGDSEWMLTAVFAMRWFRGFDEQILSALKSPDPEIHYEAVNAAGNWEIAAAWSHIAELVKSPRTPKPLLLAAISAVGSIRPAEGPLVLKDLLESEDEDIVGAAHEAIAMADTSLGHNDEEEDEDDEDEWLN